MNCEANANKEKKRIFLEAAVSLCRMYVLCETKDPFALEAFKYFSAEKYKMRIEDEKNENA